MGDEGVEVRKADLASHVSEHLAKVGGDKCVLQSESLSAAVDLIESRQGDEVVCGDVVAARW